MCIYEIKKKLKENRIIFTRCNPWFPLSTFKILKKSREETYKIEGNYPCFSIYIIYN